MPGKTAKAKYKKKKLFKRMQKKIPLSVNAKGKHFFTRSFVESTALVQSVGASSIDGDTGHVCWYFSNNNIASPGSDGWFSLQNVPNYTEFTNLFDSYKICGVSMKFMLSNNVSDITNVGNTTGIPVLYTWTDVDDPTCPTSINEGLQYRDCKARVMSRPIKVFFKPRCQTMLYQSAVSTAYTAKRCYIDTADYDVPHYGIKWIVESPSVARNDYVIGTLKVFMKFYFAFKYPN